MQWIGLSHLLEDQLVGPSSPLYWVLGAACLILLAISLYVYLLAIRRFEQHRLHWRLVRRFAILVGCFSGLGLASTAFALLAVPFLSKRLWLVLAALGLLGTAAYGGYYFRWRYPAARLAFEERERRQRYMPRPKAAVRRRSRRR